VVVVSDDDQLDPEEMADPDVEHSKDQADAQEILRLECKNECQYNQIYNPIYLLIPIGYLVGATKT